MLDYIETQILWMDVTDVVSSIHYILCNILKKCILFGEVRSC